MSLYANTNVPMAVASWVNAHRELSLMPERATFGSTWTRASHQRDRALYVMTDDERMQALHILESLRGYGHV